MTSHPTLSGNEAQIGHGSAALFNGQPGVFAHSPMTMDSTQSTQAGAHDPAGGSHRGPQAVYIGSPAKRAGSPTKRQQRPLRPPSEKADRPSPPRPGVTHRKPRSRSPSQRAFQPGDPNDDEDRRHQQYDGAHLAALIDHLSTVVASLDARVQSFEGKTRDLESDLRGQIGDANRSSKGLTIELEQKIAAAVPGLIGDLEKALVARVDKIEDFLESQKGQVDGHRVVLESLHQAKPGEEQTLMKMFCWLDAEIKRLDQEPKAQRILDEAKKVIHETISETAAQTQHKMNGLAHDLSAWAPSSG